MLKAKTRLLVTVARVGEKTYERFLIHVPSKIARDSQFPFEAGQILNIDVDVTKEAVVFSEAGERKVAPRRRKRR